MTTDYTNDYLPLILLAWAISATAWALRNCSVCNDLTKDLRWVNEQLATTLRLLGAERQRADKERQDRQVLDVRKRERRDWN